MGLLSTIGAASGRAFGLTRVAGAIRDAYFNLTTLLLPGNGTNGAQNNTFLDSSTNNFTITRNGNTTQGTFSPFSQTGWSNFFDGTDDYIAVADNAVLRPGASNFTLEAWVWRNASGAAHTIYAKGGASTGIVFQVTSTNVLRFTHTTTNIDSTGTIAANAWTHVAVVREGTGTNQTKLYINGTQDGQGTVSTDFTQTEEVRIGTDRSAAADFNGYISNLRFVKGTALYTGAFTPSTSPLTTTSQGATATEVELLTCQSNRFVDNSSNGFTLTITGTPSVQAFSPFAPTAEYDATTVGGSGYFDGTGDYLASATSTNLQLGSSDFSLEWWEYRTAANNVDTAIVCGDGTFSALLGYYNSGAVRFYLSTTGSSWNVFSDTSAGTTASNSWNHFVLTRSGTAFRVFLNGVLGAYATGSGSVTQTTNQIFISGGINGSSAPIEGYMSGIRFVKGSIPTSYQTSSTTTNTSIFTPPTAPVTTTSQGATSGDVKYLVNFTNAGITDATAKNDLETVGNAQISTTQSKFGGSSMYFDGTGDWCLVRNDQNFNMGSGDFTIEFWAYTTSRSSSGTCWVSKWGSTATSGRSWIPVFTTSTGKLEFYISTDGSNATAVVSETYTPSLNAWNHYAITRSGSTFRFFVNGSLIGSGTNSGTLFSADEPLCVGANYEDVQGGVSNYNTIGYIDDLRITKGYARYTAAFTAPTAALPLQ